MIGPIDCKGGETTDNGSILEWKNPMRLIPMMGCGGRGAGMTVTAKKDRRIAACQFIVIDVQRVAESAIVQTRFIAKEQA
jgi:hypothetical protein